MAYHDANPDTLDDIETYANHAIHDVRDLQDRLRSNARHLPVGARQFMLDTADALEDVVHDHLAGQLVAVNSAREDAAMNAPTNFMADRAAYHARLGVVTR